MSVFDGLGVEVSLNSEDDFLKVRETLTRIGIASFNPEKSGPKGKSIVQSCHILHKKGKYAIVHFKELFILDGKDTFVSRDADGKKIVKKTIVSEEDIARRNTIAFLLQDWGFLRVIEPEKYQSRSTMAKIKVISHKEKDEWELISKHSLGRKKSQ